MSKNEGAPVHDRKGKRRDAPSRDRFSEPKSTQTKDIPGLAARQAAATLLTRVVDDGRGLDGLLDTCHGPSSWQKLTPKDQSLARAIVTSALRHRGEIEFALSKVLDRKPPQKARHLIHTLHVAAAQILLLDVPDSAAVNLAVHSLQNDKRSVRFAPLANAVLRRLSHEKDEIFGKRTDAERARLNVSPWIWKRMRKDFGRAKAEQIAQAHMREPVLDITVKSKPEHWAQTLGGVHLFGNSVRLHASGPVTAFPGFEAGDWWVQDAAASLPAHLLGDIAGKRVADLCAAPGGKTAQLVAAGAHVTAVEQSADRLERLKTNLDRLKLAAECIQADMFEWEPAEAFDAILLDAPCSSSGTIRRHPDVQWAKSADLVEKLALLQKDMIVRAASFLKPGGILVFSNCSIDRAEGEDMVAQITAKEAESGLQLTQLSSSAVFGLSELITGQGTLRSLPSHFQNVVAPEGTSEADRDRFGGLDGFFAARFCKND